LTIARRNVPLDGVPQGTPRSLQGICFTARVFAPFYSEKQDYGGAAIVFVGVVVFNDEI